MATNCRIVPVRYEQRTVGCNGNIGGTKPVVVWPPNDVLAAEFWLVLFGVERVGSANSRPRVAVQQAVTEGFGQQLAFVDRNSRWRTSAGDQQIGDHTRIVLMPVATSPIASCTNAWHIPGGPRHFIPETKVAVFQNLVQADTLIAVIVIVALPNGAERING